jgi:hypothetical protein
VLPRAQEALLERDPELARLYREVDRSLIRWSLTLSPLERVKALSLRTRALKRFKRVPPDRG